MTNEEILKAAIEKAIKNGWNSVLEHWGAVKSIELSTANGMGWVWYEAGDGEQFNLFAVVFSHDFAKAFWGDEEINTDDSDEYWVPLPAWKYHLQQMVIAEEPLKYLEKFL